MTYVMGCRIFEALLAGGICEAFTSEVAHEALPSYLTGRWDGIRSTE
jgi:hypothetical protein